MTVQGCGTLLETLTEQKLFIPSACGGRGTCGLCKVKVVEGAGVVLPTEEPYLLPDEKADGIRLSCQVKVRNNIRIEIPPELFEIREYECTCVDIQDLTYDIRQFRFKLVDSPTMDYVAGQYVQLLTPAYEKSPEEVYRAYSLSSNPADRDTIELIIRLVPGGIYTTYCFEYLKAGDSVKVNGPYGDFRLSDTDMPIIFIAGGSGMAPVKCILHYMENTGCTRPAVFYFGANQVRDLFLLERMREFEKSPADYRFVPVVAGPEQGAEWNGEIGLVTEAVQRGVKNATEAEAYLCGSPGMIDAAIKVLNDLGMPDERIFYDKFT